MDKIWLMLPVVVAAYAVTWLASAHADQQDALRLLKRGERVDLSLNGLRGTQPGAEP